jgi:hypothetical protein
MNIGGHILFMSLIIGFSVLIYLAYFKDLARKGWEKKQFMFGILPNSSLQSYARAYRRMLILLLIFTVALEVMGILVSLGITISNIFNTGT